MESQWNRLSTVELGDKVLVMDRRNGKWLMMSEAALPEVRAIAGGVPSPPAPTRRFGRRSSRRCAMPASAGRSRRRRPT